MKLPAGKKIVIIGCGNVAWHLAKHFQSLNAYSLFVYNHKANPALNDFRLKLKCKTAVGLEHVITNADYYFICVSDQFIAETAKQLDIKNPGAILLHTSGSAKIEELGHNIYGTAVFYPLQTFSKKDVVNWKEIPLIVEAQNAGVKKNVTALAKQFSKHVTVLAYKERLKLHLAAVLVNNFSNALYVAAAQLAGTKHSGRHTIEMLLPLIKQTTLKLEKLSPLEAQTGPAKRHDEVVLKKHSRLLSDQPGLKKIYKQLSKLIVQQQKEKHA